jgi:hypothetical protein
MNNNKSILAVIFSLIISIFFLSGELYAFSKSDLKKLMETNNCPRCRLRNADLSGADLSGANLEGANLVRANLKRADLRKAILTGAKLTGANLTGAKLDTTKLMKANLTGANLTGANLDNAVLNNVIIDHKVISTNSFLEKEIKKLVEAKNKKAVVERKKAEVERKMAEEKKMKEIGENELLLFYASYQNLGKCFEARKGYAAVHVNTIELNAIKANASKIQDGIYKKYPALKAQQDRICKDSVKTSLSKQLVAFTLAFEKPLIGSIEITNNFSDWNEICNYIKIVYNSFNKKYGVGREVKKKDF